MTCASVILPSLPAIGRPGRLDVVQYPRPNAVVVGDPTWSETRVPTRTVTLARENPPGGVGSYAAAREEIILCSVHLPTRS